MRSVCQKLHCSARFVLGIRRIERTAVLLREVEIDRHRLGQDETVVVDRRYAPVRIERLKLGRSRLRRAGEVVLMIVGEAEFAHHP